MFSNPHSVHEQNQLLCYHVKSGDKGLEWIPGVDILLLDPVNIWNIHFLYMTQTIVLKSLEEISFEEKAKDSIMGVMLPIPHEIDFERKISKIAKGKLIVFIFAAS